ncbi:MAG: beta-N-acetylhexosaminidase [Bacteroidales bacterium]|jgi:hexosaminidase|nr:beta-N-acetylhexosaminidase [Bacteroidales bacterium]
MKRTLFVIVVMTMYSMVCDAQKASSNIIPAPVEFEQYGYGFTIDRNTKIIVNVTGNEMQVAEYLHGILDTLFGGIKPIVAKRDNPKYSMANSIIFILTGERKLGKEGYELDIQRDRIMIAANENAGFFYGVQSLLQYYGISPNGEFSYLIKARNQSDTTLKLVSSTEAGCKIADYPHFAYRGKHLDVCRHFFTVEEVKAYLDLLAYHKINTFHWHLTDDQGWRIEIKKYPLLTQIASCRDQTMIGHYRDYKKDEPLRFDGKRYCAFYTQEQIKDVVKYAAERYITVIPEIEMPGHSCAVLEAYPQYSCRKGGIKAEGRWGVFDDVLCCNDSTIRFMEDILAEVCELFPGKYIHIGGDECPKTRWKECPVCQATKQKQGCKDEHELQSYFIRTIEKFLNSKGKSVIGWDEILEGGVTGTATIMSWRGVNGGIAAAKAGNDAIMTPEEFMYFNWYQADPKTEPLAFGGLTPLEKVYNYNPVPQGLTSEEQKHIIGLQANTWTEYITDFSNLIYMDYPRVAALAEIGWGKNSTYEQFLLSVERLKPLYKKYMEIK